MHLTAIPPGTFFLRCGSYYEMSFWACQLAACSCELTFVDTSVPISDHMVLFFHSHFDCLNMYGLQIEVSPPLRNNITSEAAHLEAHDGSQEDLESVLSNVLSNQWDVHKRTTGA